MCPELESYAMVSSSWMFVIGRRWGPGFIPDATLGMYGNSRRALRMHDFLPRTLPRPPVVIFMSRPARVLAVSGQIYLRPVPARSAANAAITRTLAFLPPVTPRVAPAAPAVSQGGEGAWGEVVPMHQVGSAGAGRRAVVPGTPSPARRARAGSSAAAPASATRGGVAVAQRARSERAAARSPSCTPRPDRLRWASPTA